MKKYEAMPIDRVKHIFVQWSQALVSKEIFNVFFLSHSDSMLRGVQFIDYYGKQNIVMLDLTQEMIEDGLELADRLAKISKTKALVVLAHREFVGERASSLAQAVVKDNLVRARGVLVVHEAAPHEVYASMLTPAMYQHSVYPLYVESVMVDFVHNLDIQWKLQLSNEQIEEICRYCGGIIWLVKDIVRALRDNPQIEISEYVKQTQFIYKVKTIWEALPEQYKLQILGKEVHEEILQEMREYRLIDEKTKLFVPVLSDYARNFKKNMSEITTTKIRVFDSDLTHLFSETERRILGYLVDHRNELIPKELLAKTAWKTAEDGAYSDWAFDQKMSRLRKKVELHSLPVVIKTKKGKGYVATSE